MMEGMPKPTILDERPIALVVEIRMLLLDAIDPGYRKYASDRGIPLANVRQVLEKEIEQEVYEERMAYFALDYDPSKDESLPGFSAALG